MTTRAEAVQAILAEWVAEWSTGAAYCFQNERFDPTGLQEWAEVEIIHRVGRQDTIGAPQDVEFLRRATLRVRVGVLPNSGRARSDELSDAASQIFEGKRLSGTSIIFDAGTVSEEFAEKKWFVQRVDVPFTYVESAISGRDFSDGFSSGFS